jgi:hypothetical protein
LAPEAKSHSFFAPSNHTMLKMVTCELPHCCGDEVKQLIVLEPALHIE